jgi:hypothetical protein
VTVRNNQLIVVIILPFWGRRIHLSVPNRIAPLNADTNLRIVDLIFVTEFRGARGSVVG